MRHRHFEAGREIIHQDDTSELFAIVLSGLIKLTRMLPDGRRQIVGFLGESDCLGDLFAEVNHDSAESVTDVELCCFAREKFEALVKSHPDLEHFLFLRAMNDLDETREWLFTLGRKKATERVATFLLWLWRKQGTMTDNPSDPDTDLVLDCPLTRQDIADFLGLTLETVSRQFSKLRAAKVIRLQSNKRIEILDVQALERLAEAGT